MKFILFLLRNRKYDKPARVQKCNLTEQVNRFLQTCYLFRYNLLTDETEYRPANAADKTFVTIGKREVVQNKAGRDDIQVHVWRKENG